MARLPAEVSSPDFVGDLTFLHVFVCDTVAEESSRTNSGNNTILAGKTDFYFVDMCDDDWHRLASELVSSFSVEAFCALSRT
jgi:hypothetical protein